MNNDEKKRLKEAMAKVQKAVSAGQSEPPAPFRDPFVYVSDERVRTVLDGRQPEPLDVNVEGLQSVHHAAPGPGPKQEPITKGGKGKGKKGEKGGKGGSPSGPPPKSGEMPGKGSGKGGSPSVPKAKAKDDAGPAPMEVDAAAAQPKKTWVAIAVEGARPSAKAKMTPVPKAEPKGQVASVSEAKSAPAPKAEAKETKQAEPRVEVKKEKVGGDDAPGGSRGSAEGQKREMKSRWDPDETVKESTKREASTRPDDVDSRPGAAAREASGDDLHSALGRSSAKDAVAPLTASKAMAKKPEGGEIRLQSAERTAASPVEGHFLVLPGSSVVDAILAVSTNRVLNKQVRDFIRNGEDASALEALNQIVTNSRSGRRRIGNRMFPVLLLGCPLGLWTPGIPESREGVDTVRGARMIATEGGMMLVIVVMMIHSIGSEIEGEMIAEDPKGIAIGTARGADVTGGDVTIADRLSHEDCGR